MKRRGDSFGGSSGGRRTRRVGWRCFFFSSRRRHTRYWRDGSSDVCSSDLLAALAAELGTRQRVMVRVTTGVEAHTHEYIATAHEDQKFGFSIAGGQAARALQACADAAWLDLRGIHSHIGSQIFEPDGFEVAARRTLRLHAEHARATGVELPDLELGGGFGIACTRADSPADPVVLAAALRRIVEAECAGLGVAVPHLSIEPGRAISGPSAFALYRVGTVKQVLLDGGTSRT